MLPFFFAAPRSVSTGDSTEFFVDALAGIWYSGGQSVLGEKVELYNDRKTGMTESTPNESIYQNLWNRSLELGIPLIDGQHKKLVQHIEALCLL